MSTNSACEFIQTAKEKWFYILEDRNAPNNAWDWREYATAYGPFKTEAIAEQHLFNNHANPGGSTTTPLPEGVEVLDLESDKVLKELIANARTNMVASWATSGGFDRRY